MTEAGQTGSMTPGLELQLMTTIAEMRADMRHVRETSDKTFETVNGLSTRVSNVEADVAVLKARPEIDSTLASRVAVAEAEITASKTIMSTVQSILESRSLLSARSSRSASTTARWVDTPVTND